MKCSPATVAGSRSSSRVSRRKRLAQAKLRSTTQRRGNNTIPRLASGSLTTSARCRGWRPPRRDRARVALIRVGQRHVLAGDILNGGGQLARLRPILGIGRGDVEREQVVQRVDGEMELRALLPLMAVVPRPGTAFRRALEGAATDDHLVVQHIALIRLGEGRSTPAR
jgi:hypothetical protein